MKKISSILILTLCLVSCGDGSSPPTTPTPPTTTVPQVQTTELILSARNCFFQTSRRLTTLSVGESFTIRFKPLLIDEMQDTTWAHATQFWLGDPDEDDAIALDLIWRPDSQWSVVLIVPEGLFGTGRTELISVGGRLREITYVRTEGLSEWLLDGVVILQLPDDKPERGVFTGVVGSDVLFQFDETSASALKTSTVLESERECMTIGASKCTLVSP